MPILVRCPSCAGQLRVTDDLIGRKARCPACQTIFDAVAPAEPESGPAPPPSERPTTPRAEADDLPVETVRVEPWQQLDLQRSAPSENPRPAPGPPPAAAPPPSPRLFGAIEVDAGPQEPPRRPPPARLDREREASGRDDDLRPCPGCGKMVHTDSRRCYSCGEAISNAPRNRPGPRPRNSRHSDDPQDERDRSIAYPGSGPEMGGRRDSEPHRGNTVLVLGVLSLACVLFFWIPFVGPLIGIVLGAIAWWMGHVDLRRMKRDAMDPSGRSSTQAGWVCAILGTLVNMLWLLTCSTCIGWQWYTDMKQAQQSTRPTFQAPPKKGQPKDKDGGGQPQKF